MLFYHLKNIFLCLLLHYQKNSNKERQCLIVAKIIYEANLNSLFSVEDFPASGIIFRPPYNKSKKINTHMHSSWGRRKRPLGIRVDMLAATVYYTNDCRCKTSRKDSGERTLIWWCKMNSLYVIVSIPLLLVLAGFNHAHGLTTFGKSNSQGQTNHQVTGTDVSIYL